ncbi:MAG TPA: nuclear transport factor 2 family protein [Gemmatimonadaceae bacterium]|jgi:ketosteroid isomerase-like protein|nr:nuclear transport factor 2 family protein [Gemmatimonadaceae bacterium]
MRQSLALIALAATVGGPWLGSALAQQPLSADAALVRRQLEKRYDENRRAFFAKDLDAIMALRTDDFHTVTPDGLTHDRAEMRLMTQALLNGIDKWISTTFDIDSLTLEGDLARAIVRQHADRIALRADGQLHHVETWVTQRETWRKTPDGWKLYRVDSLRDQRRLVDGKPGS